VVVVASAGNGGEQGDRASYPAAYPGVIAVAAVDRYGNRAPFSTARWYASVSAPGVDVVIADPDRRYYEGWGTSTASAYVSGTAALLRSAYPRLSPAQIKTLLEDTTRDRPPGGRSDALGTGLIDPAAALREAAKLSPESPVPSATPYPAKFFGSGPASPRRAEAAGGRGGLSDGIAAACAAAGTVLLTVAGTLRLRRQRRTESAPGPAPAPTPGYAPGPRPVVPGPAHGGSGPAPVTTPTGTDSPRPR
jgi:subtilisin family serine protease